MGATCAWIPYGLALEGYDAIGRWRTLDEQGQPRRYDDDAAAGVRQSAGHGRRPFSRKVAQSHTFTACLAQSFLHYGNAVIDVDDAASPDSCAVKDIVSRFAAAPDQTFAGLIARSLARPP